LLPAARRVWLLPRLADGGVKRLIPNGDSAASSQVTSGSYVIDEARVREEERYDGKYVLKTTTDLPAEEVAIAYRNLLWIERLFRDLKSQRIAWDGLPRDLSQLRAIDSSSTTSAASCARTSGASTSRRSRPSGCRRRPAERVNKFETLVLTVQ
jgi:hypothetical protein